MSWLTEVAWISRSGVTQVQIQWSKWTLCWIPFFFNFFRENQSSALAPHSCQSRHATQLPRWRQASPQATSNYHQSQQHIIMVRKRLDEGKVDVSNHLKQKLTGQERGVIVSHKRHTHDTHVEHLGQRWKRDRNTDDQFRFQFLGTGHSKSKMSVHQSRYCVGVVNTYVTQRHPSVIHTQDPRGLKLPVYQTLLYECFRPYKGHVIVLIYYLFWYLY